jgi:hypothetical protein
LFVSFISFYYIIYYIIFSENRIYSNPSHLIHIFVNIRSSSCLICMTLNHVSANILLLMSCKLLFLESTSS